ncbi:hypothetical protein LK09_02610 [Microbacterium mangrovi]|uniref:Uncharacterized protein n=1 Tax=Microbacterium mangrovi TaxID=1348253 RepID=A0A0B2A8V8_9MICO|nr:hypothetical protein [Microbacterium mangrovi]KHK99535.1 hypothetical protein LK09_02610 [Microbacterium mangrovi]
MIGGRRWWLAWPVGILCVAAVAGMVYVAAPAVPWAVGFTLGVLEQGARTPAEPLPTPVPIESIGTALTDDCVSLYPSRLWLELALDPHTVLSQDMSAPAVELMQAMAPWHPSVRMTCGWRSATGGTVRSSLVDLTASGTADATRTAIAAALTQRGFGCRVTRPDASLLTCTRRSGQVTDTAVVHGQTWLSTTETGWHPAAYTAALVQRLWPAPVR